MPMFRQRIGEQINIDDAGKYTPTGINLPLQKPYHYSAGTAVVGPQSGFIGRTHELATFVANVTHLVGGSILITGFRGAGKSTFINAALEALKGQAASDGGFILDVRLNLARVYSPTALMHLLIRALHFRVVEDGLANRFDFKVVTRLKVAYLRTNASFNHGINRSSESEVSMGLDVKAFTNILKGGVREKQTIGEQLQTTPLPYDDKMAEVDFIRVVRGLVETHMGEFCFLQRLRRLGGLPIAPKPLKILVVLDEVDKLEDVMITKEDGTVISAVDGLLEALKNLFTIPEAGFVFIAGKAMHDRWLKEIREGDSLYESVFAADQYVPCLWDFGGALCNHYLGQQNNPSVFVKRFIDHLAYKGRGIPRKTVREFNRHIRSAGVDKAVLTFSGPALRRINFYSGLHHVVLDVIRNLLGDTPPDAISPQQDGLILAAHYLMDWIVRQGDRSFRNGEMLKTILGLKDTIRPDNHYARPMVEIVCRKLKDAGYVVQLDLNQTLVGPLNAQDGELQLSPWALVQIGEFARHFEDEVLLLRHDDTPDRHNNGELLDRYRILKTVGFGGMSEVYCGLDTVLKINVALKRLRKELKDDRDSVERFRREASFLQQLTHPKIVRLYNFVASNDDVFMVMEFLDGINLKQIIKVTGPLAEGYAATLLRCLIDPVGYLHDQKIVRLDIKPGNIMITKTGKMVMMDLGIAVKVDEAVDLTISGAIIGTPNYMSLEQWCGGPVTQQSDIYAIGIVLFEILTGRTPTDGMNFQEIKSSQEKGFEVDGHDLPDWAIGIIRQCLRPNLSERFQSVAEILPLIPDVDNHPLVDLVHHAEAVEEDIAKARADSTQPIASHTYAREEVINDKRDSITRRIRLCSSSEDATCEIKSGVSGFENDNDIMKSDPNIVIGNAGIKADIATIYNTLSNSPKSFTFGRDRSHITIGRAPDNNIVIDDQSISRYHAILSQYDQLLDAESDIGLVVKDQGSSQGVTVNGKTIVYIEPIFSGDTIGIGNIYYRVSFQKENILFVRIEEDPAVRTVPIP